MHGQSFKVDLVTNQIFSVYCLPISLRRFEVEVLIRMSIAFPQFKLSTLVHFDSQSLAILSSDQPKSRRSGGMKLKDLNAGLNVKFKETKIPR